MEEETKTSVPGHTRKKPNRDGKDKITLPEDLPVKTVVLDIAEEQKTCQETGKPLVQIGIEISHKLAHEPGSYYIKEIIRPKYAHPEREENGILTAALPDSLLPNAEQTKACWRRSLLRNSPITCLYTALQKSSSVKAY